MFYHFICFFIISHHCALWATVSRANCSELIIRRQRRVRPIWTAVSDWHSACASATRRLNKIFRESNSCAYKKIFFIIKRCFSCVYWCREIVWSLITGQRFLDECKEKLTTCDMWSDSLTYVNQIRFSSCLTTYVVPVESEILQMTAYVRASC